MKILDCTLRDGGYYNEWDFSRTLIADYLHAMSTAGVDAVELGFRSLKNDQFYGACAYTGDRFLSQLPIPDHLQVGVMVNAGEIVNHHEGVVGALERLFPAPSDATRLDLVRLACHAHEVEHVLAAADWLKERGYGVGLNIMQISDRSSEEIRRLGDLARQHAVDVLYFADSLGGMTPDQTADIVATLQSSWGGPVGIHAHDNLGLALQNSLTALDRGATWLDATVTGMGRGPGNTKTEQLIVEVNERRGRDYRLVPLMQLISDHFAPLQRHYGWGTNTYYYLAGKHGIHPTYIQEMLGDARYSEADILAAIDHLRQVGGKKFRLDTLEAAQQFYSGPPRGTWAPATLFKGREVVLLGTGPGVSAHRDAIEAYIREARPVVLALNTQEAVNPELIDARLACHPVRLLADCDRHAASPHPLITPASMLPSHVTNALQGKELLDFGLSIAPDTFSFCETYCTLPNSLVVSYALAVATSGQARRVLMAGFDGYGAGDPRNQEMDRLLTDYAETEEALPLVAITPTDYHLTQMSVYGLPIGDST